MGRKLVYGRKKIGKLIEIRPVILIVFALVLTFSSFMPTQVMAIWPFDPVKRTPSVLPATNVTTAPTQAIAEPGDGTLKTLEKPKDRTRVSEIESKRTPFTSTYINKDGTKTLEYSFDQQNYKSGNKWEKIDNTLKAITDPIKPVSLLDKLTNTAPEQVEANKFVGKGGAVNAQMKPLSEGLTIAVGDKTITMRPLGANNVKPAQKDSRTVVYKNAWEGVDLEYELRGESVKEIIVLKKKIANPIFDFKVTGGKVIQHPTKVGLLTVEGMPEDFNFSSLTVDVFGQGVISEERATQVATAEGIKISLDKEWLKTLKQGDFPVRIDPSFGRDATSYWMFKSDGYGCNASNCYANTGSISNNGWKHWRTYFQFPFSDMAGKTILNANLHGYYKTGQGGTGTGYPRYMGHANCVSFNCTGTYVGGADNVGGDFDINFTWGLQQSVNSNDWGTVWSLWGNECGCTTYKPYYNLRASVDFDTPTPMTSPVEPANGQVTVSTQPMLKVNPVGDADGDAVQYYFRVATSPDGESGAVINSGWISSPNWTVPDGILQDGTTYYWHTYTLGRLQTNPNWTRSFKVDLRTGKDSTQSYDTVGPMGVDLATGNATTSTGTHTMSALGGSIGLNFDYDSPAKSKTGLIGEYWNVPAGYNFANGAPTSSPALTRNDPGINFDWSTSSPSQGVVTEDWFYARWQGYFVAPTTDSYVFGSSIDDAVDVFVNEQKVYGRGCCVGSTEYAGAVAVPLQAGQVVPIRVNYQEVTGAAYMKLFVKSVNGTIPEQLVPREWLRTAVKATPSQYGLTGRYFTDDGSHNFPGNDADPMRLMMARTDNNLSFNWGNGGPAPGLQTDNFMVKWTGYVTVPADGDYRFGATADDGVRVKLNNGLFGAPVTYLDSWQDQAATVWGSNYANLKAGNAVPITIEYFDHGGGAQFSLLMQRSGQAEQTVPVSWLTPKVVALPDAWRMGVDVDGNINYERLRIVGQNVILEDSTRSTHEYTWTGSGYKPPVNEDGQLTRNANNTFTLLDADGKTYLFDPEGKLTSVTSPTDDRNPAALKYEYGGSPSRLMKITDGTTSTRYGTLHYKSINEDGNCSVPSGFDAAPDGMLCAFKTSDGDITKLYYKAGQLSRIEKPGDDLTSFGYDSLGRMTNVRDSLASDAIAANVRTDDTSVLTEVTYDSIGRIANVTAPAPTAGADRVAHEFKYRPGMTDMLVAGTSQPNGFSKRVEYDTLLRTTKETDLTGKVSQTEWDSVKDLQLSTTDATGLKSTTIYDDEDRTKESYGPAPAAWYETSGANIRRPLSTYTNQVPKTSTGYDEGLTGPAVSWHNVKGSSLFGAPKLLTQGIDQTQKTWFGRDFRTNAPGFTPDAGMDGYGFSATGKVRFPSSGTYTLRLYHDDGARVSIDDQSIINDWDYRSEGIAQNLNTVTFTAEAGKVYRLKFDYLHVGNAGGFELWWAGPGITDTNNGHGTSRPTFVTPGYSLVTSQTAYDEQPGNGTTAAMGNVTTATTYSRPEYGLVDRTTLDPTGLNLQSTATYEAPGSGFLRQTSKTLPGGGTTIYQHYGKDDTADNPCTAETEAYHQAGRPKGKIEADPDGVGPQTSRTSETIYNESGDVVATRYNSDPWTCTTYDVRGRVMTTTIPAIGNNPSRTISNDYSVGGNPLVTTTTDSAGTIRVENDLLGRTVKYTDVHGKVTTNTYDMYGKLTSRTSPIGTESYEYDQYDRLTKHKLDGVTFATVTYDQYSRIGNVQYAAGISLSNISRDTLGRENGNTYTLASGQTLNDSINRFVGGDIQNGTELGVNKSYAYDKAGRLTGATIGSNTYSYDFGAQDPSCPTYAGYDAGKDGNRTKLTVNGQTTTYCYDKADRLTSSSDVTLTNAQYDSHGNTTSLGDAAHQTTFSYDGSDRNTGIASGNKETSFKRDAQNRIITREQKTNGTTTSSVNYGFTGSGDTPDYLLDGGNNVIQKYVTLPGDVLVTIKTNSQSAGATTYSLPNIHGDVFATVNADGALLSTFMTGPFGEVLPNPITQPTEATVPMANPTNTANGTTYQYVGQHEKLTDLDTSPITGGITQMGARVYIPVLGRFLSVDPKEGGNDNNYAYVNDPVNGFDLDGNAGWFDNIRKSVQKAASWAWRNKETIMAVAGVAACVVGTGGMCLGVAVASAALAAGVAANKEYSKSKNIGKAVKAGVGAGVRDFAVNAVAGKLAGAKHVARYFGTVQKTGTTRYYRNLVTAFKKKAVLVRTKKQIRAGVYAWVTQQVWQ